MADSRFWLMLADDEHTDHNLDGKSWWAIVDEQEGGIIAYAATQTTAEIIRRTLMIGH